MLGSVGSMNLSFFSFRAWLRHLLLATWILLLAWLMIEWLLPGTISAELPIFVLVFIAIFFTLLFGPLMTRWQSRIGAALGFMIPLVAAMIGVIFFVMREESNLMKLATALTIGLGGITLFSFMLTIKEGREVTRKE